MNRLPREARDGLMRAWLDILKERHPEVSWIAGSASWDAAASLGVDQVDLLAA